MQDAKLKRSQLGLILVIGTLAILILILIGAIALLFITSQLDSAQSRVNRLFIGPTLFNLLEVDKVDPALALASLGGVPEADIILEAIDKGRPETALAGILFHPTLSDKESAGDFLRLAEAYIMIGEAEKGTLCYQMAGTIATLSPKMPATLQADVFMQVGEGLLAQNEAGQAKFYLDQAFVVASRSPYLQAAHRRFILERLQQNYLIIGERELARQSLNLSANPPSLAISLPEGPILAEHEPLPLPEPIQQAETKRWQRAQELAAILVERGGRAPRATTEALREALLEEDQQKLPYYTAELATAARVSKKIDTTVAQIEWLSIKYKVARQAFGISLVPEWETQAEQIRADLTKTYETLYALYADLIVALPEASQIDKATEERLRREILAGELGRYPNYPEEQRRQQLLEATNQLIATQPELNIFIGVDKVARQERYRLIAQEGELAR